MAISSPWHAQKRIELADRVFRLVEFSYGFEEDGWCTKAHDGYVLEGGCEIDFNGMRERFTRGDALFIRGGEVDKHKVEMDTCERVLILLFEMRDPDKP